MYQTDGQRKSNREGMVNRMPFYLGRKTIRKVPGTVIKAAPLPDPVITQGFGSRKKVGVLAKEAGYQSILLVTDQTLFALGFHKKVVESLEEQGIRVTIFSDIASEPTVKIVEEGRAAAVACEADCIVALGGGSVMDSSKIIASSAKHPQLPIHLYLHKFALAESGSLPMINIPSTAGTGAECTVGAVVMNESGVKCATVVLGLNVPHVILDSELIVNAPRSVTVWCAIDALSHGLEGLLADVASSEEDIWKSRECVRLIFENLPFLIHTLDSKVKRDDAAAQEMVSGGDAVAQNTEGSSEITLQSTGSDGDTASQGDETCGDVAMQKYIEARQATLLAAHYGGNAINTQLAGYVHAFAHSIGALYHIPHGKAIAWCLIPIVAVQENLCYEEMAELAVHCHLAEETDSVETAADKLLLALKKLLEECGLEKGCPLLKVDDYDQLTRMIELDSINYSPAVTFSDLEIRMLLDQIRRGY